MIILAPLPHPCQRAYSTSRTYRSLSSGSLGAPSPAAEVHAPGCLWSSPWRTGRLSRPGASLRTRGSPRRCLRSPVRGLARRSSALGGRLEGWWVASKGLAALPRTKGTPGPMAVAGRAVGRCRCRGRPPCQPARGYGAEEVPGCNPMYPRLQPYVSQAATLCIPGCNPM